MFNETLRAVAVVTSLLVASVTFTFAQDKLSKGDQEWMEKEVGAIITDQEEAMFQEISKDDRKLFKELFWMRRDFDPTTSDNEFEDIYERRMKEADDAFKERGRKGHETDMGQMLLLLGPPAQQVRGGRDAAPAPGASPPSVDANAEPGAGGGQSQSGMSDFGNSNSQSVTWVYDPNPQLGIPDGLTIEFRQQSQFGFRIVDRDELEPSLERVRQRLISNPAVNYVRDENGRLRKADARFDPNSPAKLALRALQDTGETSDAIAFSVDPRFYAASAGQIYVPMDIAIESGIGKGKATVFGAVENSDGFTIYQFEEEAEIVEEEDGHLTWELPLQLQPGLYTLYMGVMDENNTVTGTKVFDLDVPDFTGTELTLSSILMFSDAEQTGEVMGAPGKAFMFGGYHFEPKRDNVYTQSDNLEGIFYAYNYGVQGDKPNLTLDVSFTKDGEPRGRVPQTPLMQQTPDMSLHIFGYGLNIRNFEDPGDYVLTLKVTDHVNGTTVTKEIPFVMEGGSGGQ